MSLSYTKRRGFILVPVLLILAVISSIALISNQESLVGAKQAASQISEEQVRYSAEAGLAIAVRELQQDVDCTAYNISSSGSFNGVNYTTALSATNGSPVTVMVTANQGDSSRQLSRELKMYQPPQISLVNANADAYVYQDDTNQHGSEEQLYVNGPWLNFRRSLVSFDLSGLSLTGTQVISSNLELYLVGAPENDKEVIRAYTLTQPWDEPNVSWQQRTGTNNWNSSGGDYNSMAIASTLVDENVPGLYSWDISSVTKEWLDGTTNNYGVILRATTFNNNNKEFASKEYTPDSSKRPKLRIIAQCECGQVCTTPTQSYLDEFNSLTCDGAVDYIGSEGTLDWTGYQWQEKGSGESCVGSQWLLKDQGNNRLGMKGSSGWMERNIDLSSFSGAILTFDYLQIGAFSSTRYLSVMVSGDNGSNWTELGRIDVPGDGVTYLSASYTIPAALANANSMIRFTNKGLVAGREIYIDNVKVVDDPAVP